MVISALAFHYAQLEATAFREEFDAASFQDHTLPKNNTIHKKAGPLIKEWTKLLQSDESANAVIVEAGSKRKPVSLRGPPFFSCFGTDGKYTCCLTDILRRMSICLKRRFEAVTKPVL